MPRPLNLPKKQFFDSNGDPLAGGKLFTFVAESNIPKSTYGDPEGSTPNTNPIVLDASGQALIYMSSGLYKLVLKDADDVEQWSVDNYDGNPTTAIDGIDGKSVLHGEGPPDNSFGNDGDFYLDIASENRDMYGPKSGGEWPEPGYGLRGPAGVDGTNGIDGTNGADGIDGQGVPPGGSGGQVLSKINADDFNTEWKDLPDSVVGPSSSTDNAIARFDSTSGKLLQNSAATIDDSGNISTPGNVLSANIGAVVRNNGSVTPGSSGTYVNITSITLAPGTWILEGMMNLYLDGDFVPNGSLNFCGISDTSASLSDASSGGLINLQELKANSYYYNSTGSKVVSPTVSTTYYLVGSINYSVLGATSNWGGNSFLGAVRIK